jgi:hypothetical protein
MRRNPGRDALVAKRFLGHASTAITLKIYSHLFKAEDNGAIDKPGTLILNRKRWQTGTGPEGRIGKKGLIYQDWRGGRAVEGTGLENRQRLTSLVGSNPTPSAGTNSRTK